MGRAMRLFNKLSEKKKTIINLLEKKKEKKSQKENSSSKEKKRLSLPMIAPEVEVESVFVNSHYNKTEKELNKQAIAVVAGTAAVVDATAKAADAATVTEHTAVVEATAKAVDAAIVAASSAVAMFRLTSDVRKTMFPNERERWAAVKIQAVFRGYLAKKALIALKGLVKVQAYFRGYLVRKRVAATFQAMQVLMRTQESICLQRTKQRISMKNFERMSIKHRAPSIPIQYRRQWRFEENATNHHMVKSPKIVDMDRPRSRFCRTDESQPSFMAKRAQIRV